MGLSALPPRHNPAGAVRSKGHQQLHVVAVALGVDVLSPVGPHRGLRVGGQVLHQAGEHLLGDVDFPAADHFLGHAPGVVDYQLDVGLSDRAVRGDRQDSQDQQRTRERESK